MGQYASSQITTYLTMNRFASVFEALCACDIYAYIYEVYSENIFM